MQISGHALNTKVNQFISNNMQCEVKTISCTIFYKHFYIKTSNIEELTNPRKYSILKQVMIITVLKLGEWFLCIIEFSPPVYLVVVHPYLGTYTNMQELDGLNRDAVLKESSTHCALLKLSAMDVFCQIIACSRFL